MRLAGLTVVLLSCAPAVQQRDTLSGFRLLSPTVGPTVSLQQHLVFRRLGAAPTHNPEADAAAPIVELDALVILTPERSGVAAMMGGLRVMTLKWDGRHLDVARRAEIPPQVSAERTMVDLQLVWWPVDAVRQALPPGLELVASDRARLLSRSGHPIVRIEYTDIDPYNGRTLLQQLEVGYEIEIQSRVLGETQAP